MKKFRFLFVVLVLLISACTKEGASDTNAAGMQSGTGGSLARFTIAQNRLYVVDNRNLFTYNLSDPAKPSLVNTLFINGNVETIFPYKDKLFIGSTTGMFIYSISNPDAPVKLGSAVHVRSCDPVVANDTVAFVTLTGGWCGPATDGLYVHDIKDLLKPVLKKLLPIPTPYGLGLHDKVLYVCCRQNGLMVFNVSDPYNPVLKKTLTGENFMDVIPISNLLISYVSSGIQLYDISSPENPQLINKINN